ncbi:MAG: diguanylate cyclase [Stenotrophomonas sp.]
MTAPRPDRTASILPPPRRAWFPARLLPAWLVLLCWLCLPLPAIAAGPGPGPTADVASPLRDYAVDMWTSRDGLPHNSLRAIAQTPEGHLWFATWEGLVRYNGLDFIVYDRGSTPGLLDNGVGTLYVDSDGALWISDSRGNVLRRGLDGRWDGWPRQAPAPEVLIQSMRKDSKGRLWLLYEGRGLGYLTPDGQFVYEPPPPDVPMGMTHTWMEIDAQDRVWVGTLDGLVVRGTDGVLRRVPDEYGLSHGVVWPYRAPDGVLWIVTDGGLYRMQGDRPQRVRQLPGITHATAMLQDRHGDLWLGTENQGLFRIGSRGVEHMPDSRMLPRGRIVSLLEDAEGSIWAGANGGLYRLRETLFSSYTRSDGLSGDYARALLEDGRGRLWIGGAAGLDRMEPDGHIAPVPLRNRAGKPPSILSLARDATGDVWAGTFGDGVYRIAAGSDQISRFDAANGLPGGNVRVMAADHAGPGVWLGTQRGVVRIAGGHVQVSSAPGLPAGLVTALYSGSDGLWIGTIEGVYVLRGDNVQRLDLDELGGGRSVFGFLQVGNAMWITTDRGLYRYRDGQLARVGLEQGMPVDTVFQMVPDRLGNVWISSNRGMLRTDMRALEQVADGRNAKLAVERYNEIDGMSNAQANGSTGPSAVLRRDGTFWVATAGGVSTVDPLRLLRFRERLPPPAVIEGVSVDGVPMRWQGGGRASLPGGRRVTVDYVGLSYLMSDRIRYRTWLEGLDQGWIERGGQRSVEFLGLPPGNYTLHISAAHPGGHWSGSGAAWSFTIEPRLWQRRDAQAGAALLLLLALVALYRYLIHRHETRNIRLAQQVAERTADLREQAERLLAANQEKAALAERLREQADAFERQAHEDPLTGLPNRRAFDEGLARDFARSQRSGQPLCLVALDIDHFKRVNDTWSHSIGDQVLREVAQLLAASSRDSDLPARLGGEEFALLLNDTTLEEAELVCMRLRGLFHSQRSWAGIDDLRVTFSAGLVLLGPGDRTPTLLSQRADKALYQAKSEGRDRICLG